MDLRKITDDFSVSPQITPEDVPAIAQAGFRTILCNRPDGEEFGQTPYDAVADAARAALLQRVPSATVPFKWRPQLSKAR